MTTPDPILVLGATGKTGRRVAARLQALGLPVRPGSRGASPAFDWEDRAGWPAALHGSSAAYVSYYPDLAAAGATEAIGAFAAAARAAGLQRVVLLSGRGEEEAQRAEAALRDFGPGWTVVRCSWFAQNFDEGAFLGAVLEGTVALPVDRVREPFVDVDDVADVAVAALTQEGHAGQVYELTGPRALTFAEATGAIGRACGRELVYLPIALTDFAAALRADGVPDDTIGVLSYLFTDVLDGRNTAVADGVQRALGRPPRDFAQYARTAAATGVWDVR